jgi:hypothetical protein
MASKQGKPKKDLGMCHNCSRRPVEYTTDNHGKNTHVHRCRECYERAVYLEGRYSFSDHKW